MREYVEAYCQIVDNNNNQWGRVSEKRIKIVFVLQSMFYFQIHQEFQIQLCELTLENLLEQFTLSKHTGLEKPGEISGMCKRQAFVCSHSHLYISLTSKCSLTC